MLNYNTNIETKIAKKRKRRCVIDDGFNSELVETAFFDGIFEIPIIEKPKEFIIPKNFIPFSKRNSSETFTEALAFYENDTNFSDILQNPAAYLDDFKRFSIIISPDFSLYRDMTLTPQIGNVYRNRAFGHYLQKHGMYVIPNIRWGDERSYTTCVFRERFAFLGVPKHSIVSIGTYGCIQGQENKHHFKAGLEAMLEQLEPEIVLVYGPMPNKIFGSVLQKTRFIPYPDWISFKKGGNR